MSSIGIITALKSEANCLGTLTKKKDVLHIVSGIGPTAAGRAAKELCSKGCSGLISFGYAGALNSSYRSGVLAIGHSVSNGYNTLEIYSDWLTDFINIVKNDNTLPMHMTAFLSLPAPLNNKLQKVSHAENGSWDAVEMESYAIAEVANKHRIPLLVIRAILDELNTMIPEGAANTIDAKGQQKVLATFYELVKKPSDLRKYLELAAAKSKADKTLSRVAALISRVNLP